MNIDSCRSSKYVIFCKQATMKQNETAYIQLIIISTHYLDRLIVDVEIYVALVDLTPLRI